MKLTYFLDGGHKFVNVELLTGRAACISCPTSCVEEVIKDGNITEITYAKSISFSIGQTLEFLLGNKMKSFFHIVSIYKGNLAGKYYITCEKDNLCNTFLLPLIAHNTNQDKTWFEIDKFAISSYLHEDLDKIVLVCRYFPSVEFSNYEAKLKQQFNFLTCLDINTHLVHYVFNIRDSSQVELFLDGKYSMFSEEAKKQILNFSKRKKTDLLGQILYKCPKRKLLLEQKLEVILKDSELFSKPNLNYELF